jgi:hypothetical protein
MEIFFMECTQKYTVLKPFSKLVPRPDEHSKEYLIDASGYRPTELLCQELITAGRLLAYNRAAASLDYYIPRSQDDEDDDNIPLYEDYLDSVDKLNAIRDKYRQRQLVVPQDDPEIIAREREARFKRDVEAARYRKTVSDAVKAEDPPPQPKTPKRTEK